MIGNVSEASQARRMRIGVFAFAVALFVGIVMVKTDVAPIWRGLLIIPFWIAGNGFFSAQYKTCGFMSRMGMREGKDGPEKIADRATLEAVRCRGQRALIASVLSAVVSAVPFVLIA